MFFAAQFLMHSPLKKNIRLLRFKIDPLHDLPSRDGTGQDFLDPTGKF